MDKQVKAEHELPLENAQEGIDAANSESNYPGNTEPYRRYHITNQYSCPFCYQYLGGYQPQYNGRWKCECSWWYEKTTKDGTEWERHKLSAFTVSENDQANTKPSAN